MTAKLVYLLRRGGSLIRIIQKPSQLTFQVLARAELILDLLENGDSQASNQKTHFPTSIAATVLMAGTSFADTHTQWDVKEPRCRKAHLSKASPISKGLICLFNPVFSLYIGGIQ